MKLKVKTMYTVNYRDFEAFVQAVTGREYEFAAEEECGNDTAHIFRVANEPKCGQKMWDSAMSEVEAWVAGSGSIQYRAPELLGWLCAKGHIPPGEYCIEVSW